MDVSPVDQASLVARIESEVDRQRTEFSAAAVDEADIIAAFDQLAPAGSTDTGGAASIARLGSAAHIDVDVPIGSNRAVGVPVKKGLRKLQSWYLRYVVDQINIALALATGALEDHEKRLRSIDTNYTPAELGISQAAPLSDETVQAVVSSLGAKSQASTGENRHRTLCAWCGSGDILAALVDHGVDAYGIDPDPDPVSAAQRQGLDARNDDPFDHLREIPAGSLAALVVGQSVDIMKPTDLATIIDLGRRALADGGTVTIVADTEPVDQTRFELAGRQPLSTDAWLRLMTARHLNADLVRSFSGDLTVLLGKT